MYALPLLEGTMNFPVGSDAILPVMGSEDAKMWCDRMVGSGMSEGSGASGLSMVSGCSSVSAMAVAVVVNLVDRWFLRVWSKCPLYIAMDAGGYWRTRCEVSSGQVLK